MALTDADRLQMTALALMRYSVAGGSGGGTPPTEKDPYTKLLLHCNGTNGSADFVDESTGRAVIAHGDVQISTLNPKFGTGAAYFDGTGDFLSSPPSSDWMLGSEPFTIDLWICFTNYSASTRYNLISTYNADNSAYWGLEVLNGAIGAYAGEGTRSIMNMSSYALAWENNRWYHVAWVVSGSMPSSVGTFSKIFRDGVELSINTSDRYYNKYTGAHFPNTIQSLQIGAFTSDGSRPFKGHMDEIRVSKGIARWYSSFQIPTAEYTGGFTNRGVYAVSAIDVTSDTSLKNDVIAQGGKTVVLAWATRSSTSTPVGWTLVYSDTIVDAGITQYLNIAYKHLSPGENLAEATVTQATAGRIYSTLIALNEDLVPSYNSSASGTGAITFTKPSAKPCLYFMQAIIAMGSVTYTCSDSELFVHSTYPTTTGRLGAIYDNKAVRPLTIIHPNGNVFNLVVCELE